MEVQKNNFLSIQQMTDQYLNGKNSNREVQTDKGMSFQEILQNKNLEATNELKFSKHATVRLKDRGIRLSEEQMGRLQSGAEKAREKGIKDSLVIVDEMAFIVNIPNNTVVTAMDGDQTEGHFFTNINGAVIM